MKSLWFVVPAHGRLEMSRACLSQLARTCEELAGGGIHASAVVIAEDENLDTALELGFATVRRANRPLGRKLNDGYELAARAGVDYVVPFGTDDVVDAQLLLAGDLPEDRIRAHRLSAIVDETGSRLRCVKVTYEGGDGIRIIPTAMLKPLRYRPLDEDRNRAMDTSTTMRLAQVMNLRLGDLFVYRDLHPLQIVEFKSAGEQLNAYQPVADSFGYGTESSTPFAELAAVYPQELLDEIAGVYGMVAA